MKYDLIIIGSGSVGSAAGYYATQAGLKVLMIDAHLPPHSEGSHHGDTRLIRHAYGEGERYVPLVLRAQTLWDELAALTEERIFERTGIINTGPANSTFLATVEESAKAYRLDVERLDANGIMARWPEISVPDDYIGLFEANSGVLHSETAIKTGLISPPKRAAHSCSTVRSRASPTMQRVQPSPPLKVNIPPRVCW